MGRIETEEFATKAPGQQVKSTKMLSASDTWCLCALVVKSALSLSGIPRGFLDTCPHHAGNDKLVLDGGLSDCPLRVGSGWAMNAFDFVVLAVVAFGAIHGLRSGLLTMVTSFIALIAALYLASVHYTEAAEVIAHQFGTNPTLATVLGYVAVFLVVFIAVQFVGGMIVSVLRMASLRWIDRLAGAFLGGGIAAAIAGLAVMLLTIVLPANAALLRDSQSAPMLLAYDAMLVRYIPDEAREAYERNRDILMKTWIAEAAKGALRAVPSTSPTSAAH
jgi:membrane protein required for colicin V production